MKYLVMFLMVIACYSSCKTRELTDTELKVTHGIPRSGSMMKSVVYIINSGGSFCTGTFISSNALLTASHCIYSAQGELFSHIETGGIKSIRLYYASSLFSKMYREAASSGNFGEEFAAIDLAIAVFPPNTATKLGIEPSAYGQLYNGKIAVGDDLFVAGYGRTDATNADTAGKLHWGRNVINSFTETTIKFKGTNIDSEPGKNSSAAKGDSGGPLFLALNGSGAERIVGVNSLVPHAGDGNSTIARTQSSTAKNLFKYAIECPFPGECADSFAY